jgi:hypothetical protein
MPAAETAAGAASGPSASAMRTAAGGGANTLADKPNQGLPFNGYF